LRPKIKPNKLIWPAFWGTLTDEDNVQPIDLATLGKVVAAALKDVKAPPTGNWPEIKEEQITAALKALSGAVKQKPVYVTGGVLYQLGEDGALTRTPKHPAAAPYVWPVAHNVRPAAQPLGVGKARSPLHQGPVLRVGWWTAGRRRPGPTTGQRVQRAPQRTWPAMSFIFRPWFKVVAIGSAALIGVVLLLYGLKALGAVARVLAEED
jgi:hypothetical protein